MKRLKTYESFTIGDFDPEMISEQEYQRVKKSGIHLRFSTRDVARLYTNAKVFDPRIVSWIDGNSRGYIGGTFNQVIKNVELNFSTRFEIISIEKEDEPFVYFTINWGYRNSMVSWRDTLNFPPDSKLYGRMEYEEFEMVREDCKLWKDFCVNVVVEEDRKTNKIIQESFGGSIPDPEPMDVNEWDEEVTNAQEVAFTQKEKELFIALSDTISVKNKRYTEVGKSNLFFQLINGDLNQRLRYTTPIRNISTYKNDDEFYYVNIWGRDDDDKVYRCDGYECWEKFLKEIFAGYRELINNQTKTNESYFDEVSEPKSLLDENGDITDELSSDFETREREPFTKSEKSFISKLVNTLNEEYTSIKFYNNNKVSTEFRLTMGEMGETTHIVRGVKCTDEYYGVEYENFVDSEDEYIISECDGFKCLSKLLIRLFEKINKDYDYEGNV